MDKMIFGGGSFDQLGDIADAKRTDSFMVFLVDDYFEGKKLPERIPARKQDRVMFVNVDLEPKTAVVDELRDSI